MSNKIVVVEGSHDVQAIKRVFKNATCLITNGSEVLDETKSMLKALAKDNEIIVFTDPDFTKRRLAWSTLQMRIYITLYILI